MHNFLTDPRFEGIKPFENKIWLSSPTMHGEEELFLVEAVRTELVKILPIEENSSTWAKAVINAYNMFERTSEYSNILRQKGYDVSDTSRRLADIYCAEN